MVHCTLAGYHPRHDPRPCPLHERRTEHPRASCRPWPAPPPTVKGAHDPQHLQRVWRIARQLLDEHPEADALVVLAACYPQ